MNTKDLLDRFEILYPDNQNLKDIRRSYVDKDLASVFRLVKNEELRKAVMEKNLHSIFRLVDNEELKKLIMDDNVWSLWKILNSEVSTNFIPALKYFSSNDITIDEDCFSRGQLKSKIWLLPTARQRRAQSDRGIAGARASRNFRPTVRPILQHADPRATREYFKKR
jgi:hypothetical protein